MKVILTKYLAPTDHEGERIKAYDDCCHSITIPYPYELSGQAVHEAAARQLAQVRGWKGELVGGSTPDGYAFAIIPYKEALQ